MQIAQINIAQMKEPLESDLLKEFRDFIDPINQLAEDSPGFVWRLKGSNGESSAQLEIPFDDDMLLVNMSTWESIEQLKAFAFRTVHSYFVRQGKQWFHRMAHPHLAMWWVEDGYRPTLLEAKNKLELIASRGPSQEAFNFGKLFEPA